MNITEDSTNQSVYFYFVGDAGDTTPGEPVTGLVFGDITSISYVRQGAARVSGGTLITTTTTSHADGGFIEVDATNCPGLYKVDFPDLAFATGVGQVICYCVGDGTNDEVSAPVIVDIVPDLETTLGTPADTDIATDIANISTLIGTPTDTDVSTDLANIQTPVDKIPLSDGSLSWNNTAMGAINAQVDIALATTTYGEVSGVPAATATLEQKINWLFTLARNEGTQTATTKTLYADDTTTAIATSTVSDDGTTFRRTEYV